MHIAEVVEMRATRRSVRVKAANANLKYARPEPVPFPLFALVLERRLVSAS